MDSSNPVPAVTPATQQSSEISAVPETTSGKNNHNKVADAGRVTSMLPSCNSESIKNCGSCECKLGDRQATITSCKHTFHSANGVQMYEPIEFWCLPVELTHRGDTDQLASLLNEDLSLAKMTYSTVGSDQHQPVTLLYIAAQEGRLSVVELLIKHKADVNFIHNSSGTTPLEIAICNGHQQVAMTLVDHGAKVEKLAYFIIKIGQLNIIESGADRVSLTDLVFPVEGGGIPGRLHKIYDSQPEATTLGRNTVWTWDFLLSVIELSIKRGASLSSPNQGLTPLHVAVLQGSDVRMLRF